MLILVYMYTYNRVTSICIDLSKIKLFVFVFVFINVTQMINKRSSYVSTNTRAADLALHLNHLCIN